jgi:hypothetical protein
MSQSENITSPVGRIVAGSLYEPQTTDGDGNPRVIKNGPNAGQPNPSYFFAVAIPKNPGETHWSQTEWGQKIWGVGHTAFPQAAQSPAFAWKVEDGDSQIPNTKGKRPCENEGFLGHWVIKLSSGFAPKIYQEGKGAWDQITTPGFVKPGYYVQVAFTVRGNGSQQKPGVYLNHNMVAFRAFGAEISFGPDVSAAGFGAAPLPAGASLTPLAATAPLPAPPVAAHMPPPAVPVAAPAPAVALPPVVPNTQFANVAAIAPPPAPPVAPEIPVRQMTAAANGITYEQYKASGWTDDQLVANGLMVA